jgi:hypothetical protein
VRGGENAHSKERDERHGQTGDGMYRGGILPGESDGGAEGDEEVSHAKEMREPVARRALPYRDSQQCKNARGDVAPGCAVDEQMRQLAMCAVPEKQWCGGDAQDMD